MKWKINIVLPVFWPSGILNSNVEMHLCKLEPESVVEEQVKSVNNSESEEPAINIQIQKLKMHK